MTADQQKQMIGISAEAHDGYVIIDADRSFQCLTPREVEVFHGHLAKAYREARRDRLTVVADLDAGVISSAQ